MKIIILILIFSFCNTFSEETNGKSPSKAMLYSIVPGGGQVYNEDYWKAPIMFAGAGIFLGSALYFNSLARETQRQIDSDVNTGLTIPQLRRRREFQIDNRDQFYFYFAGVYIISLLDAYTGAYLYNFDVNEDTSLNFGVIDNNKVGIELKVKLLNFKSK
jgi:hypothetical protein